MEDRVSLTIGTAGHVDHGKTTLVRYMTGTDTDRLEEEHRRGISILPGYAELDLPGGRRISLIDVPGHERFVRHMVSGSTGVDAFLLVVAADDGVMPQTREHLDVLRLLGVRDGVVALTKIDAVDSETAGLARLEVEELLEEHGLSCSVLPVSGVSGEGVDELLAALDELSRKTIARRAEGLVRLPVDRAFVIKGVGMVATGTLWSGTVRPGDTLYSSAGYSLRVRTVQNHGRPAHAAYPGARTALNLTGPRASEVSPGELLTSKPTPLVRGPDVRLHLLPSAAPLPHGRRVRLYHGTRHVNARVRLADRRELTPGESAYARLMLAVPLPLLAGDRFILRSLSPQHTIGGGLVLTIAPPGRRPDPAWLSALESRDADRLLSLAVARHPREGITPEELANEAPLPPSELRAAALRSAEVEELGGLYAPSREMERARSRLLKALERRAADHPEAPELSVAEARSATGLSPRLSDALLSTMDLEISQTGVSLPGLSEAPAALEREAGELLRRLAEAAHEPPSVEDGPALRLLLRRGDAVRLAPSLVAAREAEEKVFERIRSVCEKEGGVTLARLRDLLSTSRKYAQAWLEHADGAGLTRRVGDVHHLTRRYRG